MKTLTLVGLALLALAPLANATHVDPCEVASAPVGSYLEIDTPDGKKYYQEERGNPFGTPIPMSGFFFGADADGDGVPELLEGEGSWTYEESNGLVGLQRGGIGLLGDWFPPGCDQEWGPLVNLTTPSVHPENAPEGVPCLIIDEDPINDETCHAGPDTLII